MRLTTWSQLMVLSWEAGELWGSGLIKRSRALVVNSKVDRHLVPAQALCVLIHKMEPPTTSYIC